MSTESILVEKRKTLAPKLRFKEFTDSWKNVSLGDVTEYTKGFAFKSEDFVSDGVRVVRVSDLGADLIKSGNDKIYLQPGDPETYGRYFLKKNNIIVTTVGSKPDLIESAVGRAILVRKEDEGLLNQNLLKFENIDLADNGFIYGILKRKKYHLHIKGIARGNANQSNITVVDLLNFKLSIPSLPEQQKIASFLSAVDEKIQQLTRKKELLEQYKKGVMQQLFSGKLRFKDENGKAYPKWEEKRLGDVAKIIKGKGVSKTDIADDGELECIRYGELYTHYTERISKVFSRTNLDKSELVLSEFNDVIIPSSGETQLDIARAACVLREGVALGGDINILKTEQNGIFLSYYINHSLKYEIAKVAQGNSVVHLYPSQLEVLKITLPSLKEQIRIADIISSLDVKIESIITQITNTETFKKGLLQQMFV